MNRYYFVVPVKMTVCVLADSPQQAVNLASDAVPNAMRIPPERTRAGYRCEFIDVENPDITHGIDQSHIVKTEDDLT